MAHSNPDHVAAASRAPAVRFVSSERPERGPRRGRGQRSRSRGYGGPFRQYAAGVIFRGNNQGRLGEQKAPHHENVEFDTTKRE